MKYCRLFFLLSCILFGLSCSKENLTDPDNVTDIPKNEVSIDTVDFRGLVYLDRVSIEGHLGGSERVVRQKMEKFFNDVTLYWNRSGNGRLNYYYRYVLGDIVPYDCGSNNSIFNNQVYNETMDFSKYDFVVVFDALLDKSDDGKSGGGHSSGSDSRSVIKIIADEGERKNIFDETTRNTLTHELGHYRGVTDVYQYIIDAKDNPVSNQKLDTYNCIMRDAAVGVWCDYAVNCMNLAGDVKQIGKVFPDFFNSLYPKNIEINATVAGKPERGVVVKIYGSRAGATGRNRDIYPQVFVEGKTDSDGKYVLYDVKKYFNPKVNGFKNVPDDLPYGRWFGFLAEVSYGSEVKYVWMSEIDVQMVTFEGKDSYTVNIDF